MHCAPECLGGANTATSRRWGGEHPKFHHPREDAACPHPWKLPGTVILRLTSAFMTRLTIS